MAKRVLVALLLLVPFVLAAALPAEAQMRIRTGPAKIVKPKLPKPTRVPRRDRPRTVDAKKIMDLTSGGKVIGTKTAPDGREIFIVKKDGKIWHVTPPGG